MDRAPEALTSLDRATALFGSSAVLMEQRANVLFQVKDDTAVLELWQRLRRDGTSSAALDSFAFRRAAISAARLTRWSEAEELFLAGAAATRASSTEPTRFGLMVDAALMSASGGDLSRSARLLVDAIGVLPKQAAEEGNLRWEAALRVTSEVCRFVETRARGANRRQGKVDPGWTSSPALVVAKAEPGQAAREALIRAEIIRLAASACIGGPDTSAQLQLLLPSSYTGVRWFAAEAQLGLAYDADAGPNFINALQTFERALLDLAVSRSRGGGLLNPDNGPDRSQPLQPERFQSLIVAGLVCAGPHLIDRLMTWRDVSTQELGAKAPLTAVIQDLLDGARQPTDALEQTVRRTSNAVCVRVGAAARLLLDSPTANLTLQLQLFLISAMADDAGIMYQGIWNAHVAHRFGSAWRALAEHRFQFIAPRASIPALLAAIDELDVGTGSLAKVMSAAQSSVGGTSAPFMSRIQ